MDRVADRFALNVMVTLAFVAGVALAILRFV